MTMASEFSSRLSLWSKRIAIAIGGRIEAFKAQPTAADVLGTPGSGIWQLIRKFASTFNIWLWVFVFFPTLCAGVFYFGIASNLYMSEADFIVKNQSISSQNPFASLLQTSGVVRSSEDTFSVNGFLLSRDAVRLLDSNDHLRDVFNRPEADFVTRFPGLFGNSSFEKLYQHYLNYVDVTYDSATGLTRLQVKAYRPEDAQMITQALLAYSEQLINRLNARAEDNSLEVARNEVQLAEENLEAVQNQRAQLGQTKPSLMDRNNAGAGDNSASFSSFDKLELQHELAQQALASAMMSLQTARIEAQSQHLYIEHISEPNLPDYPLYPRRFWSFVLTVVTCLVIYGVAWLLVTGVREHGSA